MTPKLATEKQVANDLRADVFLRTLFPVTQNEDTKVKHPYIVIVATPTSEVVVGSGLWNISVSIEVHWRKDMPSDKLDDIVTRIISRMRDVQQSQQYAVSFNGEPITQFINDTIRKRIVNLSIIAAVTAG